MMRGKRLWERGSKKALCKAHRRRGGGGKRFKGESPRFSEAKKRRKGASVTVGPLQKKTGVGGSNHREEVKTVN